MRLEVTPEGLTTVSTITADTTLNQTHKVVLCNNSSNITVTLPAASSNTNREYYISKIGNNTATVTIDGNGTETITSREGANTTLVLYIRGDHVRIVCDGIGWHVTAYGLQAHQAKMTRDVAQSIPNNTVTKIAFDNEEYDIGGIADAATNDRFDIRRAGKYHIHAFWAASGIDDGEVGRSDIKISGTTVRLNQEYSPSANADIYIEVSEIRDLAAGDYVEFEVIHNEGAAINTLTAVSQKPKMSVTEIF